MSPAALAAIACIAIAGGWRLMDSPNATRGLLGVMSIYLGCLFLLIAALAAIYP